MAERTKKPPTRILITRHGQTVTNTEGRFCGHSETDLTPRGKEQASALGRRLRDTEVHAVYTSDLGRAMETAALILEGREITASVDPDLRELHYGEWELEKGTVVQRRYAEQHRLMRAEDPAWHPPGGENVATVRKRTHAALQRIIRKHTHQTVLIVSHGTAINCMLSEVLGAPVSHTFRISIGNCGLSEVIIERKHAVISLLNDQSHLVGIASPAEA
ncbi:hypothetical protein AYO38_10480 [bacterium SCGC AG-212-C10]|nr:hypothetical protein AYO38_10480 [bacterium SCGC AG-212-C10]